MRWLRFIVKRKILIGLMAVLAVMIGSYAVFELNKELLPDIKMDGAYVEIRAEDLPAIEMERTITSPLEQKLQGIDGLEDIHSTTTIGRTTFQITFEEGSGDDSFQEVESIVNASASKNQDINNTEALQYGTTQDYEFYMDVSGGDMDEMTNFVKDVLKPRLEELPEVREVDLGGTTEQQMNIEFNQEEIKNMGLDVLQVTDAIQQTNHAAALGQLNEDNDSPSLRWNTTLESIEDVENIKIPVQDEFIELKEIAEISLDQMDNSSFVWKNGSKDFVFAQVGRASDVTQIDMADAVREEIQNIREEGLVNDFDIHEVVAQADYVQNSIDGVTNNVLLGGIIAIVMLFLFLRNVRATFIVGISIPTSILLTFAAMWMFDYSINILTLIGLGLGIGMMVDSSIVILESIYRKKELGLPPLEAVIEGTKEVATAVIASMLTTIVVFLPIGLIGGEMGQFMIMLSAVVAITLISSVLVSFTLIPSLSEKFLKLQKRKRKKQDGILLNGYSDLISRIVKKKRYSAAVIGVFVFMFAGSLMFVQKIPMTIMPDMFNRYAELMVDLETGVTPDNKKEIVSSLNDTLSSIEDVESSYVLDNGSVFYTIINMTKDDEITRDQKEVNEEILRSLRELEDSHPIENVQDVMSGEAGAPVQVNIKGEDFEKLQTIADDFIKELEETDGVVGVTNSMERTSPELMIELNEEEIEEAGLSQTQIRQFMEQAFFMMPLGEMTIDKENIPLTAQWDEQINSASGLLDLDVSTGEGEESLSRFVQLTRIERPNEISHVNGERSLSVTADIEETDLGTINRDVQQIINDFDTPAGYSISAAGDLEQQQELIQEMLFVLGIAIFLVYLVMAVQFNHLIHPIIVMSVIPMTFVGAVLGLLITQRELSIMSGMGVIMLIGIVLNNAILLIDRTNQLRRQEYSVREALIEAGRNRIRPILMTTLTTAGGMLPLALASGTAGNYQAPMATVIISGLLFASLITLLLIPAVYRLFTAAGTGFGKWSRKKKQTEAAEENESAV
ncbi:efflux RND transporter permease subunit [Alteribacillus bidgolensis]|uniref:Hydrophobic/amphiphilic exporter-1, HAE1 family n=1 Tax=Alteribacillus bidgolensis TaxID=930129 RepID=A0A1G8KGT6_9BACI|nr:efflux RND transporter permease subunit [Alteribacillus bidgolensis]SDI42631.1 hydrophobic/amphiphilic exporter-1, HAE1 family [Alteribacillus bidgolensis]